MLRNLCSKLFRILAVIFVLFMPTLVCSAQTYCIPADVCTFNDYIQSFSTTGGSTNITNNNTGCTGTGYTYYPTMIHTGIPGGTVNYSFTNNPSWGEYYKIWVDWNSDGDFIDAGEQMYASTASITAGTTVTGSFIIPSAATAGTKRLRIRCAYAESALDPCLLSLISDGETEDYVLIVGSSACSGTPTAGTIVAGATSVTCNSTTSLALNGNTSGTGLVYQWQYNNTGTWVNFGTNAATQTSPAIIQNTQIRCQLTCSNTGGGTSTSPVVTISPIAPVVNIGNDTTICPGIAYVLSANPGASYSWSTGATTQSITVSAANMYYVNVIFANGCKNSDTILITPGITPVNNLQPVTDLCEGSTADLNAGNTGSTFIWSPGGETTQIKSTTTPGNQSVTIRSIHGCKITSSTNIILRPLPIPNLGNDTSICNGATITLDAGNSGYSHSWSNGATSQTIPASDSGMYVVTTTSPYNCTINEEEHIAYLPSPTVEGFNFVPKFYQHLGTVAFFPLNPLNVNAYEWDFGDYSPVSNQINPTHDYTSGGDYNVTVKVFNGCGTFQQSQVINIDLPTGVVTLKKQDAAIFIYPNPSNNEITVNNKTPDIHMQQISVFNILGALVYKQPVDNSSQHKMDVSNFASGIYSIRILTDKGFVVQKFEVIK